MSEWRTIESAPKDGTAILAKRVYERRIVAEGPAVWALPAATAPMRQGVGPDPLGRLTGADYRREADARERMVASPMWLKADRMYKFPEPTHWQPLPEPPK